ncbi:Heme-regulated cyclic AMP phosphodiesterase, putative, partial [Ricinus communis]
MQEKPLDRTTDESVGPAVALCRTAQPSTVIFYRLRGDPTFAFFYLSHDIENLGHDREIMVSSARRLRDFVHPHDQSRFDMTMARLLNRDIAKISMVFRLFERGGTYRWFESRCVALRDALGRLLEVEGVLMAIGGDLSVTQEFARRAFPVQSTEPVSRQAFIEYLDHAFAASQCGAHPFALLVFELQHAGSLPGRQGLPADSEKFRDAAGWIMKSIRPGDVVARWTDNQLIVLQRDVAEPADAAAFAGRLKLELECRLAGSGMSVNVGICPYDEADKTVDYVLTHLNVALHRARYDGQVCFASAELDRTVMTRRTLANDLPAAIASEEFELLYQPEIELSSGNIIGLEAMVRWHHPACGLLPPAIFLPVAGRANLMPTLGRWILNEACRQMSLWRDEGVAPLFISINLSLFELEGGDSFVREVGEI